MVVLTAAFGLLGYSAALARAGGPKRELPPITKEQLSLVERDVETAIGLEHRALREMQKGEGQAGEAPLRASQDDLHSANDVLETTHGSDAVSGAFIHILNAAGLDDRAESDIGQAHLQKLTLEYITKALEQKQLALGELDHASTQAGSLNACAFFAGSAVGDEVKVGEQGQAGAIGSVRFSANGSTQNKPFTLNASSLAHVGPFSPPTSGGAAIIVDLRTLSGARQSITQSIPAGATPASDCTLGSTGGSSTGGASTSGPTVSGNLNAGSIPGTVDLAVRPPSSGIDALKLVTISPDTIKPKFAPQGWTCLSTAVTVVECKGSTLTGPFTIQLGFTGTTLPSVSASGSTNGGNTFGPSAPLTLQVTPTAPPTPGGSSSSPGPLEACVNVSPTGATTVENVVVLDTGATGLKGTVVFNGQGLVNMSETILFSTTGETSAPYVVTQAGTSTITISVALPGGKSQQLTIDYTLPSTSTIVTGCTPQQ
jgi:hypothetical protein